MSGYTNHRLGRVPDHEVQVCNCKQPPHPAPYRAECTTASTGVVNRVWMCGNRAAGWADRVGLSFPPGFWTTP